MLQCRVLGDEREVGMVQRGLLQIAGMSEVTQGAGLRRETSAAERRAAGAGTAG